MSFVALSRGVVIEETDGFNFLYQAMNKKAVDLDQYEYDYTGKLETKRISVRTRLSDNITNYVAVACGLNYTVGFPAELLKGVRDEDIEDLKAAKIDGVYDLVSTTLLSSNAETIHGTLSVIHRIKPNKKSEAHGLEIFAKAMENCYKDFYAEYWRKIQVVLKERAERFERILNAIKALDCLEQITRKKLPVDYLKCFVVDVFRRGGGIYFTMPNRIIMTSSSSSTFIKHLDIGHEGGHIMTRGWQKQTSILNELNLLGSKIGEMKYLKGYIDECLAALIQLKMDQYILQEKRKTHGFMEDAFFRLLDSQWEIYMQNPENKIEDLLLNTIRKAMEDEKVVSDIRKRVCVAD